MTDPKLRSIPEWQCGKSIESKDTTGSNTTNGTSSDQQTQQSASRTNILKQAAKFLDAEEVRNGSTDRKISFLESKGLTKEEVHQLLGFSDVRATSSNVEETTITNVSSPTESTTAKNTSSPLPPPPQSYDVPPIITYPEFLLHSQKPPPLITARRLLNTFYLASGAAAAIYGTSQYLVSPMIKSLTSARHSLFETACSNLHTLQEKLEEVVSVVPPSSITNIQLHSGSIYGDDESSITSDPAELFHRDTGTQTSMPPSPLSPTPSVSILPTTTLVSQQQRLQKLHSHLSGFLSSSEDVQKSDKSFQDEIYDLNKYLDGVCYGRIYDYTGSTGKIAEKDDEIAKVKAEIRGIKGVLLSSKTFPSGLSRSRTGTT